MSHRLLKVTRCHHKWRHNKGGRSSCYCLMAPVWLIRNMLGVSWKATSTSMPVLSQGNRTRTRSGMVGRRRRCLDEVVACGSCRKASISFASLRRYRHLTYLNRREVFWLDQKMTIQEAFWISRMDRSWDWRQIEVAVEGAVDINNRCGDRILL